MTLELPEVCDECNSNHKDHKDRDHEDIKNGECLNIVNCSSECLAVKPSGGVGEIISCERDECGVIREKRRCSIKISPGAFVKLKSGGCDWYVVSSGFNV